MTNATSRDMRAGWSVFRSARGDISLAELNRRLFEHGYGPVSVRSYDHFRKLQRAGVDRYIAINRFDVARASAPYENASANTRYRYVDMQEGVQVLFSRGGELYEVTFVTDEVGETGAVLGLLDDEFTEGLRHLGPASGDMVSLRFVESGRIESGRVVELDLDRSPALLEVEFDRLLTLPIGEWGTPRSLQEQNFILRALDEESTTIDVAGRRVFYFFEFLEGVRSVANLADQAQAAPRYSPPSRLDKLRIESSPQFTVELTDLVGQLTPIGLVSAVIGAASLAVSKRKQWFEGSVAREAARTGRAEAVRTAHEARLAAAEADIREIELRQKRAEEAYRREIHARLQELTGGADVDEGLVDRLIDREILPALRRLGESEISSLEREERN